MIGEMLERWRERRRVKMVRKILVERAGLRGRLEGNRRAGFTSPHLLGAIAECNEMLRQFGYREEP